MKSCRLSRVLFAGMAFGLVLLLPTALLLSGCGGADAGAAPGPAGQTSASTPASSTTPASLSVPERLSVSEEGRADSAELVKGYNAFSLELFQKVRKSDENLVCSPYSAATVLTMTMAGARGQTQEEMKQAMRITLPYYRLNAAVNALEQDLADNGQFTSANGLWAQTGRTIKQPFVDVAGHYYGASLDVYDMENDYAGLCKIVNDWVSERTNGMISDLMDPKDKPKVRYLLMMLVNAVHFKGEWAEPFWMWANPYPTPFHYLDGRTADVDMMINETEYRYVKNEDLQGVELPFVGGMSARFAMTILMPAEGRFEDYAASRTPVEFQADIAAMEQGKVHLTMPLFEIDSTPAVTQGLQALGMNTAFDMEGADFTGIAEPIGGLPWFISHVEQKARIKVNEKGAEAAAATGVTAAAAGSTTTAKPPVKITIDRPFVYLIRDVDSGAIIFIGQVVAPQTAGAASPK